mmetsp:Transcript_12450/g.45393  ORF Transcript_12450/g.45393 Transcript_12450/m.45393 type:complete len:758 (+) Transcript_12450:207-2480(+)
MVEEQPVSYGPTQVRLVRRNLYKDRFRKVQKRREILLCDCPEGGDCGEGCINRDMLVECAPDYCKCGDGCTNQNFQKRNYKSLEVRWYGKKGYGICAMEAIKAGDFVYEYCGEVVSKEGFEERKARYKGVGSRHYYFMTLASNEVIDAHRKGNLSRFTNHSCEPNCKTQKWDVRGEICIGLFAMRDIGVGEEITIDYQYERYGDVAQRCYCGTKSCKKLIGVDKSKPGQVEELSISDEEEEPEPYPMPELLPEQDLGDGVDPEEPYEPPVSESEKSKNKQKVPSPKEVSDARLITPASRSRGSAALQQQKVLKSEVEEQLEEYTVDMGGQWPLKDVTMVVPVMRLFKEAMAGGTSGMAISVRDTTMILDSFKNSKHSVKVAFIENRGVVPLHQLIIKLLEDRDKSLDYIPVIRKILKLLDALPMDKQQLLATYNAGGQNLSSVLLDLKSYPDRGVKGMANDLMKKFNLEDSSERPSDGVFHERGGGGRPLIQQRTAAGTDQYSRGNGHRQDYPNSDGRDRTMERDRELRQYDGSHDRERERERRKGSRWDSGGAAGGVPAQPPPPPQQMASLYPQHAYSMGYNGLQTAGPTTTQYIAPQTHLISYVPPATPHTQPLTHTTYPTSMEPRVGEPSMPALAHTELVQASPVDKGVGDRTYSPSSADFENTVQKMIKRTLQGYIERKHELVRWFLKLDSKQKGDMIRKYTEKVVQSENGRLQRMSISHEKLKKRVKDFVRKCLENAKKKHSRKQTTTSEWD